LGWDIDTPHSAPRGSVFPIGSFGHTGFTGVTLWIDPGSETYVIILANVIHQRGGPPIARLSGEMATVTGRALHLYGN
jgi:CubicO group peptidase (beta-lactamase class C family)